jgi:hypothetical protein
LKKQATVLLFVLFFTVPIIFVTDSFTSAQNEPNTTANPQDNYWTSRAPMPTPRFDMRVAVVNNKIYVLGGYDQESKVLRVNEVYDPTTNTWTTKAPIPTSRADFAIAVYQNKIYCIGGNIGEAVYDNKISDWQYLKENEVYYPATYTWENKAPLPTIARAGMNAAVANGVIYIIGGNPNATLNEAYNPETDTWSTKASIQYYQETNQSKTQFTVEPGHSYFGYASTVTLDEKIYWIGDMRSTGYPQEFMLVYNPINDSWSAGTQPPDLAIPRTAIATTGVWAPKQIYVVSPMRVVYNPATDKWSSGKELPGQDNSGYAVVNDKIYCFGGRYMSMRVVAPSFAVFTGEVVTADNKEYIPFGYGTIPPVVSAVSVQNGINVRGEVSFNFSINKPTERIDYSLDGADNLTITGNFTLTELSLGWHNVRIYATDSFGNVGTSETINFTVGDPFTIIELAIAASAVVIGIIALLVYQRKSKLGSKPKKL